MDNETLKFNVIGLNIRKDNKCDFTGIIANAKGRLKAEFLFSPEWDKCPKAAVFKYLRKEYAMPIINNFCDVPPEVLGGQSIFLYVVMEKNGRRTTTNKLIVRRGR